jgi:3-phenylpropionate/trans-cinnamate dioxygenase ferredoxin reductase component
MRDGIVIAGGGLAAQRASETLRRRGYAGSIRMVCAEPHLPYDRPPLSKGILTGEISDESVRFRPAAWYEDNAVDPLMDVSTTDLSTKERRVGLSDGTTLRYDRLLIATGSRPRALPMLAGYENVSELRTIDDAQRLRRALGAGMQLTVVGAGFIGMEVASTARKLGAEVTMIEAAPSPVFGVLGEQLGTWFAKVHRDEGVEVITDRTVIGVRGDGAVSSLRLSDGRVIETDHVIAGVGVQPNVEWLAGSGLANGGVTVTVHGQTDADGVFAAGDAAATYDHRVGRHVAGSHWEAAGRQAVRAARSMLGLEPGTVELSSFWTDQYGIRIQYLGNAALADAIVIDGDPERRNFTATFTQQASPVAALLVDRQRSLPAMRKLINPGGTP